ncbi:D-galactarate dehydratase [Paenibacillus antri]|uniref:D-galactarate dehydratase n=1 Tax=Paenibacillus antri TaxID=2582848 RepID=A0A5R9GLK7_9BACL|nr:UxaA family hydrolase [Paenibacillus antri]TLS54013.1 D-galactarate dehydratase [Paenibacillus antri]
MTGYKTVWLHRTDNVATALEPIEAGAVVKVETDGEAIAVELRESIEFGHKFAVRSIGAGEDIRKYGSVIGAAKGDIRPGEHVHVHNLEGKRGRGDRIVEQHGA